MPLGLVLQKTSKQMGTVGSLFVVVFQTLSHVQLFMTPWTAACQASLFFTISWSLLKLTSITSVVPSKHLILCYLLLLSVFPSIRAFSDESVLPSGVQSIEASASVLLMNIQDWFPLGLTGLILQFKGLSGVFSNTTAQNHQVFSIQPSLWFNSHIHTWLQEKP